MSAGKKGSWDLPTYNKSGVINFANPLGTTTWKQGDVGTNSGTFDFTFNPETQDYNNKLTAMRNAILSGLGYTAPAREASLNEWEDTFNKEALRTSQPQLEQSLFARGLGGSKFYQDSLTDLLSKVATQGVLNRETLANNDEQLKLNQLAAINPEIANLINQANALSLNSYGATENQYQNLFPYLAKYNQKKGFMDLAGGGIGALASLALAPFTGGASLAFLPAATSAGSSIGGMFNEGPSSGLGNTLSSLVGMGSNIYGSGAGPFTGYGANTPIGVQNTGSYSRLPTSWLS